MYPPPLQIVIFFYFFAQMVVIFIFKLMSLNQPTNAFSQYITTDYITKSLSKKIITKKRVKFKNWLQNYTIFYFCKNQFHF